MYITVSNRSISWNFDMMDDLAFEAIIGGDFIRKHIVSIGIGKSHNEFTLHPVNSISVINPVNININPILPKNQSESLQTLIEELKGSLSSCQL